MGVVFHGEGSGVYEGDLYKLARKHGNENLVRISVMSTQDLINNHINRTGNGRVLFVTYINCPAQQLWMAYETAKQIGGENCAVLMLTDIIEALNVDKKAEELGITLFRDVEEAIAWVSAEK